MSSEQVAIERFNTVPLFEGLHHREIMELLRIAEDVVAESGQVIVSQGDRADGFFVIGAGAFEVVKRGANNKKTVLARLEELSYFGEMALVRREPRSASVVCVAPGRLKKFPSALFDQLIEEQNLTAYRVIHNMCRILAERLSRVEERLVS
ncbi:MAG: cyclic nucleotide-binding domain-containing protein [Planctomycetota bacterium]